MMESNNEELANRRDSTGCFGLRGKAVIIHASGDNYSDQPAPLGGGGARIACGVFQ